MKRWKFELLTGIYWVPLICFSLWALDRLRIATAGSFFFGGLVSLALFAVDDILRSELVERKDGE